MILEQHCNKNNRMCSTENSVSALGKILLLKNLNYLDFSNLLLQLLRHPSVYVIAFIMQV